jgi:hypothetical protein
MVDSICINQNDEAEKVSQIQLMQEIYTWATVVYTWLGDGTPGSNRAIKYLDRFAKLYPSFPTPMFAVNTSEEWKRERTRLWAQSFRIGVCKRN